MRLDLKIYNIIFLYLYFYKNILITPRLDDINPIKELGHWIVCLINGSLVEPQG